MDTMINRLEKLLDKRDLQQNSSANVETPDFVITDLIFRYNSDSKHISFYRDTDQFVFSIHLEEKILKIKSHKEYIRIDLTSTSIVLNCKLNN